MCMYVCMVVILYEKLRSYFDGRSCIKVIFYF